MPETQQRKVILKKLTIINFRNIKSLTLDFGGRSAEVRGRNRVGKTNCIQALHWLLTDYLIGSSSDLATMKPRDDTSAKVSVEGVFGVGGEELTLKKEYYESWVRHHGDPEAVMEGHCTDYWVNGTPSNLKTYERSVSERLCFDHMRENVDLTQLLINPFYLPIVLCDGARWKEARKLIIDLIGDVTNDEVFAKCPAAGIARNDLEAHRYKDRNGETRYEDGEARKAIRSEIDALKSSILGKEAVVAEYAAKSGPSEADYAIAVAKGEEASAEIAKLNSGDSSAYDPRIDSLQQALIKRQKDYADSMRQPAIDRSKSAALYLASQKAQNAMWEANRALSAERFKSDGLTAKIKTLNENRERYVAHLNAINKTASSYAPSETCPVCHQKLPAEQIDSMRESYLANLKSEGQRVMDDGIANKKALGQCEDELSSLNVKGLEEAANLAKFEADKAKREADDQYAAESSAPQAPSGDQSAKDDIASIESQISELREAKRTAGIGVAEKIMEIRAAEAPYRDVIAAKASYDSAMESKKKAEAELARQRKAQADAEGRLAGVDLFVKTKLGLLDDHISKVFGGIRFQLVSQNIKSGSYDEVCMPYAYDFREGKSKDVLFPDGSKSEQILTGLAISGCVADALGLPKLPALFDEGGEMDDGSLAAADSMTGRQLISVRVSDDFASPTLIVR